MAPVIQAFAEHGGVFESRICVTAQHREMLDQTLNLFGLLPDYDLDVMADNQSPTQVAAAVLAQLEPVLEKEKPEWVLLQGDTTTTAAAALASFHAGINIAHIEAGLRTNDKYQPFPEEINRRIVSLVASLHFAATEAARDNLLREGIGDGQIVVTGNPVIDALQTMLDRPPPAEIDTLLNRTNGGPGVSGSLNAHRKLILVTAHRRENFGRPLENICEALLRIADRFKDRIHIVYPVHANPNVREPVLRLLGDSARISLTAPLDYLSLVHLAKNSHIILTDSGGLQEEGPSLGKPVLVMRQVTERPEAVAAGKARLIGLEVETIVSEVSRLVDDHQAYESMSGKVDLYGDGKAGARIVEALLNFRK